MDIKELTIKELSGSGQVIRTISCSSGFITVFRSYTYADLKPYQRALAGISGAERFLISVDDAPFEPSRAFLVGFGEQFNQEQGTVRSYLEGAGAPPDGILSLLAAYNLDALIDVACKDIPAGESRMVRLLGLSFQRGGVAVLNDPFEVIPSQWRNRFAELMVQFARSAKAIVVVTALSSRPESWIDNEFIVRTQVGETRQKTIGFGAGPSEMAKLIQQVRDDIQHEELNLSESDDSSNSHEEPEGGAETSVSSADSSAQEGASSSPKARIVDWDSEVEDSGHTRPKGSSLLSPRAAQSQVALSSSWTLFLSFGLLILVVGGGYLIFFDSKFSMPRFTLFSRKMPTPAPTPDASQNTAVVPVVLATPEPTVSAPPPVPSKALLLDQYPEEIRVSILHAVEGKNGVEVPTDTGSTVEEPKPALVKSEGQSSNLFQMLESASVANNPGQPGGDSAGESSYVPPPPPVPPESNPDMGWEERREMMRQRFLESIRAASEG